MRTELRARMKRRQRVRTITIAVTIVVIAASLVIGFYLALNTGGSALDKQIGQPVSASDMTRLNQISNGAYGPSGSSLLVTSGPGQNLKSATGAPFMDNGKPVVVYIGGDFCPYCAVERWSLIISLSRFGNFSNLHYMTSASNEGDFATFTFTGSSYSSKYLSFQPIEQEDRNRNVIATVPANYSAAFTNSYPFVNFGNKYILQTLIPNPNLIGGKNWTQILSEIASSDSTGSVLLQGANADSALICKITNGQPGSVCNNFAVSSTTIGLGASVSGLQVAMAGYVARPSLPPEG